MSARLFASCLVLAALLTLHGALRSREIMIIEPVASPQARRASVDVLQRVSADALDDAAATLVANDPFRLANRPASVRFLAASPGVAPSMRARPQLVLRAIIGGPPWSAVVEGIPGQSEGVVVTEGLAFDLVRIRSISRDSVVVQASDTTWTLTMKGRP